MKNPNLLKQSFFHILLLLNVFASVSLAAANYPGIVNERFALRSMRTLHSAQITYAATYGNGNYGTLNTLGQAQFIDPALATGIKYGYVFTVSITPSTTTSPAGFMVTATPQSYRKTGKLSFFIDAAGEIRGADKGGRPATVGDPVIDDCTSGPIAENELCTVRSMRTLHGAEFTYSATFGNGNFTGLVEMGNAGLISSRLASGQLRGYSLAVVTFPQTKGDPARFRITAVPQTYGVSGIRSFFIDSTGVIHGADKNGAPADENDPPI